MSCTSGSALGFGLNKRSSIFIAFKEIKLVLSQFTRHFKPILIRLQSDFKVYEELKSIVSSANRFKIEKGIMEIIKYNYTSNYTKIKKKL